MKEHQIRNFYVEYVHAGAKFPHNGYHEKIIIAKNEEEARKIFVEVADMFFKGNPVHRIEENWGTAKYRYVLVAIINFEEVTISDTNMTSVNGSRYEDYDIQGVQFVYPDGKEKEKNK